MLWLLVMILAVLAIGGGVALSKFLFLLLIAALVVALVNAVRRQNGLTASSARLASALGGGEPPRLGVDLCAEEQRGARQPEPDQGDHDGRERPPLLVVRAEAPE